MSNPAEFFFAGGTLRPQAPSYVTRPADHNLLESIRAGEFCYVLTSRQMGKSSLMVRTARKLADEQIKSVIIDLTSIGTVSIDEWYLGLLARIRAGLRLTADVEAWWRDHGSLSVPQRFGEFLRDVALAEVAEPLVIFIDEIDTTLNLNFRDDFFAAIRAVYNARATEPIYSRLTFVLLGVATPTDLIQDRDRTPFNIGRRILLREFSYDDAEPLRRGLEEQRPDQGDRILARIFDWTNGHPYLTQKLCIAANQAAIDTWDAASVGELVEASFFSEEARKDSNLTFVQDRIQATPRSERRMLLKLYRRVYHGEIVPDDDRSPIQNHLELFGLVRVDQGVLRIRNEIYRRVFDQHWIAATMPSNRQLLTAVGATLLAVLTVALALTIYSRYAQSQQEIQADAMIKNFITNSSPAVRMQALAGLMRKQPYDQTARALFFALSSDDQRTLFQKADATTLAQDIVTVIDGIYPFMNTVGVGSADDPDVMQAMWGALNTIQQATPGPTGRALPASKTLELWHDGRQRAASGCRPESAADCPRAIEVYTQAIDADQAADQPQGRPALHYDRALAYIAAQDYDRALADLNLVAEDAQNNRAAPPDGLKPASPGRFINADYIKATVNDLLERDPRLLRMLQERQTTYEALAQVTQDSLLALATRQTATAIGLATQTQVAIEAAQAATAAGGTAQAIVLSQTASAQIAAGQTSTGVAKPSAEPTRTARPTIVATPSATPLPTADLVATNQAATAIAAQPAQLVFDGVPDRVVAGDPIGSLRVQIQDSAGRLIANDNRNVTLTIEAGSGTPKAKLRGSTARAAENGTAAFRNLAILTAGAGYRLRASADGLPDAVSPAFDVAPGPAAKLAFADQPDQATIHLTKPPQTVVVEVHDQYDNLVTNYDGELSGGIYGVGSGGFCGNIPNTGGAATPLPPGIKAVNGRFSIDNPGGSVILDLRAPGLQGVVRRYVIYGAPTLTIQIIDTNHVLVEVVDAEDRAAFGYKELVKLTVEPALGGGAVATLTSKADIDEYAACFAIPDLPFGTYTLRATSGNLAPATAQYTVREEALTVTPTVTPIPATATPTATPLPPTATPTATAVAQPFLFVASTGDDTSACRTASTPCKTLGAAIAKAASGDTINIAPGTYAENLTVNQNLTLKGAGSGSTIIDGNQAGSVFTIPAGFTVLIADLTIRNGKGNTSIGGGLMNNGDVTLTNVALINNSGPFGSAIRNPSKLTLINSVISNNTNSEAGTILSGGTLTIDKSTFSNNSTLNGGALYIAGGTATISNSTFSGNSSGDGGAIFATGTVTIQNSTISGNSANNGGGLVTSAGATSNVTIINSTIAGNSAQSGGGIKKYLGSVTLKNTIVAGNNGSNCVGGISSAGYNLSGDSTCAIGGPGDIANVDPKLGSLANNGGSTATHALAPGSPAIDAGNPAAAGSGGGACPAADQRGVTRPQGARCDIGAYEAP